MNVPVRLLRWRRGVQLAVAAALCALPWLNAHGWHAVMGDFYALRVGHVPFADPLAAAQVLAAGALPGWRLALGAGLALGLALALGRVFCGWLCPYGLLSEWAWALRRTLRQRGTPVTATGGEGEKAELAPQKEERARRGGGQPRGRWFLRAALTLAGLAAGAALSVPVLNALSAPGLLSLGPQLAAEGAAALAGGLAVVAVFLAVDVITGRRWWCSYACPQALLLMLAARCGGRRGFAVHWTPGACSCRNGQRPCAESCSLGLNPRGRGGPPRAHCVQCGDCVTACARRGGALRLGTGQGPAGEDRQ